MRGTIRQRLTVSVVAATGLMLALLILGFNLALRSSLDADANRLLAARAQAAQESIAVKGDRLIITEASDQGAPDALVWVFDGRKLIEHPQSGSSLDSLAASLAGQGRGRAEDGQTDIRLYAAPVTSDGRKVGTVVSGVSLEPYERTAHRSMVASIILGLVLLILVAVTTRMVVDRALRPVARMTAEAADWSEHDIDRRFNEGGPDDELSRLASTFDTMLDRLAFMLRHERQFSAELSHELRTPLSAIAAEAELALARERSSDEYRQALVHISERSADLTRILETLLDVARSEGGSVAGELAEPGVTVKEVLKSNEALADSYGVRMTAQELGGAVRVQMGPETLKRILGPVLENALTFADSSVSVSLAREGRRVEVKVTDDGPGFTAEEAESAFEPGRRGSAERNPAAPAGTGLGLSLARRLARANGGDVTIQGRAGAGGGSVVITLPEALDRDQQEPGRGQAVDVHAES